MLEAGEVLTELSSYLQAGLVHENKKVQELVITEVCVCVLLLTAVIDCCSLFLSDVVHLFAKCFEKLVAADWLVFV